MVRTHLTINYTIENNIKVYYNKTNRLHVLISGATNRINQVSEKGLNFLPTEQVF